ncbi:hypothetical protein T4A_14489 [Trichinella pseudospiralis]|uniref:Uncharacterized protein n=1 Tax=Trichinella pseudospiralis TaxID=6337 RepID=A0A0V1EMM2_TRIPS|nr:hypothetical protein T4A_14489 [Trichinella pseudospiralis]
MENLKLLLKFFCSLPIPLINAFLKRCNSTVSGIIFIYHLSESRYEQILVEVVKADRLSEPSSFSLSGSFCLFTIIAFTHPMLYIEYLILENAKKTVDELNCQDGGTEIEIKEFY